MKKLALFALLLVAIVAGIIWYTHRGTTVTNNAGSADVAAGGHPNLLNATFTFEDGPLTLKGGKASVREGGDAFYMTEIDIDADHIAYGDLNGDGKEDGAAILIQSGAGSGVFLYVVAYVSGPASHKGTNAAFLGDRVEPKSITIKNEAVTVTYLDRRPDEPFAAEPTISKTETFRYKALDNTIE